MGCCGSKPAVEPSGAPVEPSGAPPTKWWEAPLPAGVVVRKEVRKMSAAEQERYAAAVLKMRENTTGPGTSLYFQLACIHGGVPQVKKGTKVPESPWAFGYEVTEHCAHGRECFPGWHRPYMLAFEHGLRRADMALGGDGMIGLPYWDWTETEVNGEVLPGIVRKKLMEEFPADFWPPGTDVKRAAATYVMSESNDDKLITSYFTSGRLGAQVDGCLKSVRHEHHACRIYGGKASLETPHDNIHVFVGGIMATYQSSFHPSFWLHHNNVDRVYEKYLELEPDSQKEFEEHQQSVEAEEMQAKKAKLAGFPDGPWGRYLPFKHPTTGAAFHARDTFDLAALGVRYDELPAVTPPQMRERPYMALFKGVDVKKLGSSRLLYLYTLSPEQAAGWAPPAEKTPLAHLDAPGFATAAAIFFIDSPAKCHACMSKAPYDLAVDVTPSLRALGLDPATAELRCVVYNVREKTYDAPDGIDGLSAPTLVRPKDATALSAADAGLAADDPEPGSGLANTNKPGDKLTWSLDARSVPKSLPLDGALAELDDAFGQWAKASGLIFERVESGGNITINFEDMTATNENVFDGPGGKLAHAQVSPAPKITFDSAERWELFEASHPHKVKFSWDDVYFKLLPVALHEIGHLCSLTHSEAPADVMAPFYDATKKTLTENDLARTKELFHSA